MSAPVCFATALLMFGVDGLSPSDARRYKKELKPGIKLEQREEAMRNVAFFDDERAAELLLDAFAMTLRHLERLEEERSENDERIRRHLEPQILHDEDGMVNIIGVEKYQDEQRRLGELITREEKAIRMFRNTLATLSSEESLETMMEYKPRHPRLGWHVLQAFGEIDHPVVSEYLVEQLDDGGLERRLVAAQALARHDPERVPPQAYGRLLSAEEWPARSIAMKCLARIGGPEALQMLIEHMPDETGHQLTKLVHYLERMTGEQFGNSPRAWLDWWQQAKDSFTPRRILISQPLRPEGRDARYFGLALDSLRVVFVLDISQTMAASVTDPNDLFPPPGESRLDMARRELKASIAGLPSAAVFNLVAYNDVVLTWEESLQEASSRNKKRAYRWLDQLKAVSATNIYDALEQAYRLSIAGPKDPYYNFAADTILFLSDGGPTAGRTTDCEEILDQVYEWNRLKSVTIHVIGIGNEINRSFLTSLARKTGGQVLFRR